MPDDLDITIEQRRLRAIERDTGLLDLLSPVGRYPLDDEPARVPDVVERAGDDAAREREAISRASIQEGGRRTPRRATLNVIEHSLQAVDTDSKRYELPDVREITITANFNPPATMITTGVAEIVLNDVAQPIPVVAQTLTTLRLVAKPGTVFSSIAIRSLSAIAGGYAKLLVLYGDVQVLRG